MTYEIVHYFKSDLMHLCNYPVLEFFITQLKTTESYNVKCIIGNQLLPLFKREQIIRIVEMIDEILKFPPENSVFKRSINPIATGCLMYWFVDNIGQGNFMSRYNIDLILKKLTDQMVNIL